MKNQLNKTNLKSREGMDSNIFYHMINNLSLPNSYVLTSDMYKNPGYSIPSSKEIKKDNSAYISDLKKYIPFYLKDGAVFVFSMLSLVTGLILICIFLFTNYSLKVPIILFSTFIIYLAISFMNFDINIYTSGRFNYDYLKINNTNKTLFSFIPIILVERCLSKMLRRNYALFVDELKTFSSPQTNDYGTSLKSLGHRYLTNNSNGINTFLKAIDQYKKDSLELDSLLNQLVSKEKELNNSIKLISNNKFLTKEMKDILYDKVNSKLLEVQNSIQEIKNLLNQRNNQFEIYSNEFNSFKQLLEISEISNIISTSDELLSIVSERVEKIKESSLEIVTFIRTQKEVIHDLPSASKMLSQI